MIISHEHKYVFVEFPRTGTTAISKELCLNYFGKRILIAGADSGDDGFLIERLRFI